MPVPIFCVLPGSTRTEPCQTFSKRACFLAAEGGLVDRAVEAVETLVGPVELSACLLAVRLGPALVLRFPHAAGEVAQADQGGQALACHRAVGPQRPPAVDHRNGLPVEGLANGPVVGHEKAALADVALQRRQCKRFGREFLDGRCLERRVLRQLANCVTELAGQVAACEDAVALVGVEGVLAGPGAQDQFGMIVEVAVDRDFDALDGQWGDAEPVGIGVTGRLVRRPLAEEEDVRHHGRALPLEGVGGQADRPDDIGLGRQVFADRGVLLVEREMRRHQGQHAARPEGVDGLGEEVVVQR
jgi:hypothetical protein